MKKVLCDKDGEFISIHDEDYYLMELNDGDYLTHKNGYPFTHYDLIPAYRFSTLEEKKLINNVLSENGLYYDEKEKCLKKLRCRAKIGNSYYYIDWNRFVICKATEEENESDNLRYKTLTISRPRKKRISSCLRLNRFLMIKKECYIWVGQIVEYRGNMLSFPHVPLFRDPYILTRTKI